MGLGIPIGVARLGNSVPVSRRYLFGCVSVSACGEDNFVHCAEHSGQCIADCDCMGEGRAAKMASGKGIDVGQQPLWSGPRGGHRIGRLVGVPPNSGMHLTALRAAGDAGAVIRPEQLFKRLINEGMCIFWRVNP